MNQCVIPFTTVESDMIMISVLFNMGYRLVHISYVQIIVKFNFHERTIPSKKSAYGISFSADQWCRLILNVLIGLKISINDKHTE